MSSPTKGKALRVQGSRSRTGCSTCKLKHVKCDEAIPVCGRCARNKRTCHYGDTGNTLSTAGSKFIVYTIPKQPGPSFQVSPPEKRALWHFQYRTLAQIEGPFRTELWSTIIPRLIQSDPIIRQAVMALSSFHEHYLDSQTASLCSPNLALEQYRKARQMIIKLDCPDDFFDSLLFSSIIFSACEGLCGDFHNATQHASAGLKMIAARATATNNAVFSLTASEKTLFTVFLDLQSQIMDANSCEFNVAYPGLKEEMLQVPERFKTMEDAMTHLQILVTQVFDLYGTAEEHHQTYPYIPSLVSPFLQPIYEALCAKYHAWESALSPLEAQAQNGDHRQKSAYILLKIFAFSYKIYLYVFVHGETAYDDLIDTNYHILSLVETFLNVHPGEIDNSSTSTEDQERSPSPPYRSLPSSFSSYPGMIPVVFEIATRTNDYTLSQKAIQILRFCNQRESIWDSRKAASLAEKLINLKEAGEAAAETQYPGYKFLITDIQLLSEREYSITSGFKKIQPGSFDSWWLETIPPDQGIMQTQTLTVD